MRNHSLTATRPLMNLKFNNALRCAALLCAGFLLFQAPPAAAGDALGFFKNYFVTGDYVTGGTGLRGLGAASAATQAITGGVGAYASGVIHMSGVPGYSANGVPQHADIVAAYLYWQVIANPTADPTLLAKGTFRGLKVVGTLMSAPGTMSCWSSGGGSGNQSGAQALLAYRADVLKYLPFAHDPATGRPLGQRLVNDADLTANGFALHSVSLPDSGAGGTQSPSSGNQAFLTEGASLVVVYRVSGAPLKSVVIYNGGYTFSSINPSMTQTIKGFYQASTASPVARMTQIVGDGDSNFKEQLTVNGSVPTGVSPTNPFQGALGSSWDNLTFPVNNLMSGNDSSISTALTPSAQASTDCLSWSAMIFSTTVQDTDGDGLLDIWESSSGLTDPNGQPLPDLHSMGADKMVKDVFVEIDAMKTGGYSNATQGAVPAHSHLPALDALQKIATAFGSQNPPIKIHFDVGNNYQPSSAGTPVSVRPDFIVPSNLAAGGNEIAEASCGSTQAATCLFPDYPGTVSWKNGFSIFKNQYFGGGRKDMFHYVLFAHALGLPRWRVNDKSLSSIVVTGGTATATTLVPHGISGRFTTTVMGASARSGLNGTYSASVTSATQFSFPTAALGGTYQNWGLAMSDGRPRSNSGVSDVGGGDLMVTLGRWDNFIGSTFMQASTLLHELGHNQDLGHGGDISDPINCKPNYQSSMSYLFQVRGLLDPNGVPHIDYSHTALPALNEGSLSESPSELGAAALPYLLRWYAPASSSFLDSIVNTTPATKYCDGRPITGGMAMVRIDGSTLAASPVDWNGDGSTSGSMLSQDINFDGAITGPATSVMRGFNDWSGLNLQQIGARRGAGGSSADIAPGQDLGDDLGIAGGDLGIAGGDLGIAGGDLGIAGGDLGIAGGDLGIAGGDLGIAGGDLGGELDFEAAKSLGAAPNALTGAVVGQNIDLNWSEPNVGTVSQYQVWRATCPRGTTAATCTLSPSETPARVGFWTPGTPLCDAGSKFCDASTKKNTLYIYFVTDTVEGKQSGASNQVKEIR